MGKPAIKKASVSDIPVIRRITQEVWPPTYTAIIGERQVTYMIDLFYTPGELKKQMEEKGHLFIICYSDDQPAAFASWSEMEQGIFKLHKIYILPAQQGKGIGKFMINYIVNDIKKKGASSLYLNVNRYNEPAIVFYEKNGFKNFKTEDIDIGNGYFMNDYVLTLPV